MHLGVFATFAGTALCQMISADPWSLRGKSTSGSGHQLAVMRLRHELPGWYASERAGTGTTPSMSWPTSVCKCSARATRSS
eukprot:2686229-Lingulodinium_polyedra.AAC.1